MWLAALKLSLPPAAWETKAQSQAFLLLGPGSRRLGRCLRRLARICGRGRGGRVRRGAAAAAVVEGEGGDSSSGPWLEPGGREDGRREGAPSNKKKRPMRGGGGGGETNARALQSHFPPHFHAVEGLPPIRSCCCRCCDVFSPPSLPRFRTANGETFARWPEQKDRCRSEGGEEDGRARNATRERRRGGKCLCPQRGRGRARRRRRRKAVGWVCGTCREGGGGSVEVHSPQISLNSHTRRRRGRPPCALWCRRWRRWPTATAETETEE